MQPKITTQFLPSDELYKWFDLPWHSSRVAGLRRSNWTWLWSTFIETAGRKWRKLDFVIVLLCLHFILSKKCFSFNSWQIHYYSLYHVLQFYNLHATLATLNPSETHRASRSSTIELYKWGKIVNGDKTSIGVAAPRLFWTSVVAGFSSRVLWRENIWVHVNCVATGEQKELDPAPMAVWCFGVEQPLLPEVEHSMTSQRALESFLFQPLSVCGLQ